MNLLIYQQKTLTKYVRNLSISLCSKEFLCLQAKHELYVWLAEAKK